MRKFIFKENAKEMYDTILEVTPKHVRETTKNRLCEALEKVCGESGEVTEEIFLNVIKETTPEDYLPMALYFLEPLITKKTKSI